MKIRIAKFSRILHHFSASLLVLGCLTGTPAYALETGDQALEEVMVTAQKREQNLQDVSAAITSVGMDRLQSGQINNLEDLQMIVPSITLGNDFNMAKLFIRGVGANTSTTGSEPGVALHVDGVVISRAEAQLTSLFDLERVEVLRGPQGTLYGRNAVGGSINLITAKPTEELGGYARVSVGDFDMLTVEGAVSGPITERILGRFAFKTEDRDGFGINPVTGNDVDDLNRKMFRGQLQFNLAEDVDFLLSGEIFNEDDAAHALKFRAVAFPGIPRLAAGGVQGGGPSFAIDPRDLASEVDPQTDTETWSVTGTLNWRLNDKITLTSISNYRDFDSFITQDLDVAGVQNSLATTGFNTTVQRRDVESEQWSTELQLKYSDDGIDGVLGFFYFDENQRPVDTVGFGPVLGQPHILGVLANPSIGAFPPIGPTGLEIDGVFVPNAPVSADFALTQCNTFAHIGGGTGQTPPPKRVCIRSDLDTEVWAIFGQANINLGRFMGGLDSLSIKLGGRYSEEKRSAANPSVIVARNGLGPIIMTTTAGSFNSKTFNKFTPEIGFEWRANDDVMFYYTYSEGFKAGAGENAAPGPATGNISTIVDPEEIQNHEVGLKSTWLDNRLALNLSGFSYDLQGQQINKTIAGGPAGFSTLFENAAQVSGEGLELEFYAVPVDGFRVNGSVAYIDAQYDDFLTSDPLNPNNIATGGPPGFPGDPTGFNPREPQIQLAGNTTRNTPEWAANLHAEVDINNLGLPYDGRLTLMGDVSYKDDIFFTEFNRFLEGQESYTILDFNLRYAPGGDKVTLDFWVKNASDKLAATSTFQLATARTIGVTYLPPRTYGFTLGYRF